MNDGFRFRMDILHTWAGLVLGGLLFAIFWTGTLSVFDKEIDRWMMPATRIDLPPDRPALSVDRDILPLLLARSHAASAWSIVLPGERSPFLTLAYDSPASHIAVRPRFHPVTLEPLGPSTTRGASNFIYPFHHNLTMRQSGIGAWLVGIASMAMLCLLVSGIVIHRKRFAEFFTLRVLRSFGRANLDLHNVTGVVLLPFTLVITLSGLIIAHLIYFPQAPDAVLRSPVTASVAGPADRTDASASDEARAAGRAPRGGGDRAAPRTAPRTEGANPARRQFLAGAQGRVRPPAGGQPAGIASIDRMIEIAERDWGPGTVSMIRINNPGDSGGVAALRHASDDRVTKSLDNRRFALATGAPLPSFASSPAVEVWNFIGGMHYIHFRHWPLRWLYFLGGLGACLMIATGLLHWTQARNKGRRGARLDVALMNTLNLGAITGILIATAVFLVANRLLDGRPQLVGIASRDLEVDLFFGAWAMCALHAAIRILHDRSRGHLRAWAEQSASIAALAVAAVVSNWVTTGDHLVRTLFTATYWPVAAVDLSLLVIAGLAVFANRKLRLRIRVEMPGNAGRSATGVVHG